MRAEVVVREAAEGVAAVDGGGGDNDDEDGGTAASGNESAGGAAAEGAAVDAGDGAGLPGWSDLERVRLYGRLEQEAALRRQLASEVVALRAALATARDEGQRAREAEAEARLEAAEAREESSRLQAQLAQMGGHVARVRAAHCASTLERRSLLAAADEVSDSLEVSARLAEAEREAERRRLSRALLGTLSRFHTELVDAHDARLSEEVIAWDGEHDGADGVEAEFRACPMAIRDSALAVALRARADLLGELLRARVTDAHLMIRRLEMQLALAGLGPNGVGHTEGSASEVGDAAAAPVGEGGAAPRAEGCDAGAGAAIMPETTNHADDAAGAETAAEEALRLMGLWSGNMTWRRASQGWSQPPPSSCSGPVEPCKLESTER